MIPCVKKISEYAYSVFMAQFFVWPATKTLMKISPDFFVEHRNWKVLICATLFCAVIAVVFREIIEKKCNKIIISAYEKRRRMEKI